MGSLLQKISKSAKNIAGIGELHDLYQKQISQLSQFRNEFLLASDPKYSDPRRLNRYEEQVLSQFGEDGIIAEIFRRIGTHNQYFVEFGAGEGIENNTAALLLKGWRGFWVEGSPAAAAAISHGLARLIRDGKLTLKQGFVTRDNIESLFQEAGVPQEFDLLSIDIDGNDYWVWKEIKKYSPRVVVAEYNATFGSEIEWVMKYNPRHVFDSTNFYGSSLKAYERLFAEKGYRLVGCSFSGVNAFFVRQDLATEGLFLPPFTSEKHFEPPRHYSHNKPGKRRSYKIFDT